MIANATARAAAPNATRHATADRSLFARDDCHLLVDRKQCAAKACSWCHGACAADCSEGHPSSHARRNGSSEAHASADRRMEIVRFGQSPLLQPSRVSVLERLVFAVLSGVYQDFPQK